MRFTSASTESRAEVTWRLRTSPTGRHLGSLATKGGLPAFGQPVNRPATVGSSRGENSAQRHSPGMNMPLRSLCLEPTGEGKGGQPDLGSVRLRSRRQPPPATDSDSHVTHIRVVRVGEGWREPHRWCSDVSCETCAEPQA